MQENLILHDKTGGAIDAIELVKRGRERVA